MKIALRRVAGNVIRPVASAGVLVKEKISGTIEVIGDSMSAVVELSAVVWIAM